MKETTTRCNICEQPIKAGERFFQENKIGVEHFGFDNLSIQVINPNDEKVKIPILPTVGFRTPAGWEDDTENVDVHDACLIKALVEMHEKRQRGLVRA